MWEPQERVDLTLNTESNDRQMGIHSQEQIKVDSKRTQKEEVGARETHIVKRLLKTEPSPPREFYQKGVQIFIIVTPLTKDSC